MLNKYQEEFKKNVEHIMSRGRHAREVLTDNISCMAYAIENACNKHFDKEKWQRRESAYMEIVGRYKKEDVELFAKNFNLITEGLEFQICDFLGPIFEALGCSNAKTGQFFTPYHLCEFMVEITAGAEGEFRERVKKEIITISDPCCGAGAMLIPYAQMISNLPEEERGPAQRNVFIEAQDLDPLCAKMCYVQLSLLGFTAVVKCGNSLIPGELSDIWYSPMIYMTNDILRLKRQIKEQGRESEKAELLKIFDDDIFEVLKRAV